MDRRIMFDIIRLFLLDDLSIIRQSLNITPLIRPHHADVGAVRGWWLVFIFNTDDPL